MLSGHCGRHNEYVLHCAWKGDAGLTGKGFSWKITFKLDFKGLARLYQAEEGKEGKKEQPEGEQGGRNACGIFGGQEEHGTAEHES